MKTTLTLLTVLLLAPLAALHAAEPVTIDLANRVWQGIPGLERTAKGRVFVSWFTGGPKEPKPENTVLLCYSDDAGKTFTSPQVLAFPGKDGTRTYDPALWIDPKGRLWYIFNRSNKDTTVHGVWARICSDPDASPPVFGADFRVGFDAPFAFRMNKVTVLSTGAWIMPVTYSAESVAGWGGFDAKQLQGVGISTDEGMTWKLHGAIKTRGAALENMVTEMTDGRLWMLIRTGSGYLWESHSADQGRTWSDARTTTITNPHSRFFIRRLASGNLLMVNHHKFSKPGPLNPGRDHLTAQLSTDDGATWCEGLLLDERGGTRFPNGVPGGVSYPDGVQDKDGLIWIAYDRDRNGPGEILLARFREEDVVAGKHVSGAVSLKQVVNRLEKPANLAAVLDADDTRITAMKSADREKLGAIFSEELHYAHSTGAVDAKASLIALLTSGKTKYTVIDYDKRDFSFPAPGFALMTGQVHIRSTTEEAAADNVLSFLAAWRLEDGQWRFLAWQSCKLPPAPGP